MESQWRQSHAGLDTCESLEDCFRKVFGDTACEAVEVKQQLPSIVSGGLESEDFWKELYLRIFRPLFFARAHEDPGLRNLIQLDDGVFVVELKRAANQPPWKQPWWNGSRYLDPAEVEDYKGSAPCVAEVKKCGDAIALLKVLCSICFKI